MNTGHVPGFVKQYGQVGDAIRAAFAEYADEVKTRKFPL
jgi:ketopantoate hydroxymethyltransferase